MAEQQPRRSSKFLYCEFQVNPGETSMRIMASMTQHVSSADETIGKESTPGTYLYHHLQGYPCTSWRLTQDVVSQVIGSRTREQLGVQQG